MSSPVFRVVYDTSRAQSPRTFTVKPSYMSCNPESKVRSCSDGEEKGRARRCTIRRDWIFIHSLSQR